MDCLCRPSRIMSVRINLLDETSFIHEIKDDLPGQALLDVVFARLNLIEISYFGIRYIDDENQTHWLDPASRISRQLKPKLDAYDLYFGVKFYAADPCKLLEEITRYQLFLQVKQDVIQGRLPVAFELAAELGAFVVQSELGDYDARRHSKGYVSEFRLLPNQSNELETRVAELHQQLMGMSPATAELSYLDKVKWHDMYGVDLHPVLGEDSVEYFLGLTPSGIVVLRNKATVAHYYWPRIAKVYYKGRYFMLRISDKNNELSTYGFETPRKSACKHLWRCCVEHHAFFRLVRVAPLSNSQSNNSDFFQLGSRLKYSSRSEKHVSKDAMSIGRTPPAFTRVPSKRQPRRVIDDFLNGGTHKNSDAYNGTTKALLPNGIPISTVTYESPYRSTYSIPTSLSIRPYHQNQPQLQHNYNDAGGGVVGGSNLQTPDSPRSTRSAPWPRSTQQRSLFGHNPSSPRSVRSVSVSGNANGHQHHHHHHHHQSHSNQHQHQPQRQHSQRDQAHQQRYRSNSMESHSSNDSRSTRRHKHRHRRTSDNESELSRGSGRSGRSHHRKHRRSRHRRDSAGSADQDSTRGRSYSGHRSSSARSGSAELIDSALQWREAQRRQAEAGLGQSSIQQAAVSKSSMVTRSLNSNDSHSDTHSHHKSRRHRKNKSPSDSRTRIWSSELARHLQFDLVDTAGMTEDQLREIPYTVVETNSKRSTSNLKIHKSNSKNSVGGKSTGSGTASHGNNSSAGQAKNRVDRIRGLYLQGSQAQELTGIKNGSIRSASTISSRECERNNGLVRMMSSMSMGDFITPVGTNLSPLENSALRVSHEHTDSGLGADQDYAYSSERSSDSTRYGTNKSSGASSGSHRKSAAHGAGSGYNNLLQQTVSNQQQQHQQQYLQQKQQNQKPRETSLHYAQKQTQQQQPHEENSHKHNYKYNPQSVTNQNQSNTLAPIHNLHKTNKNTHTTATNHTNSNHNHNNNNHPNPNGNGSEPSPDNKEAGNRLLNYTTFENNQYKFSLNNIFGKRHFNISTSMGAGVGNHSTNSINTNTQKDADNFVEWPKTPAAPYYYQMPSTSQHQVAYKKRDAKSDIGVPIGHLARKKMQYLGPLGMSNTSCYPLLRQTHMLDNGSSLGLATPLQPAKSELFLSYMPTTFNGEHERPYIYNYKMPEMPEFLRSTINTNSQQQFYYQKQQQQQQHQQQQHEQDKKCDNSAYYISGAQTADLSTPLPSTALYNKSATNNCNSSIGNAVGGGGSSGGNGSGSSLLYGGAQPATDVMYYQFDNGKLPIVQQPKSLLNKTTNCESVGPLVFVHHSGQKQKYTQNNVTNATNQKSCTNTNNKTNTKSITNISNMHMHPNRSQLDIDEEDETEDNEDETMNANSLINNASQYNNENKNNHSEREENDPMDDDADDKMKTAEKVFSLISNSHSSNNNRIDDAQLLSTTISTTAETRASANDNTTTANKISTLTNYNLDNCNANINPVQPSNTTSTNITNDKNKTSLTPNVVGTYICNRNQNDTMTSCIENFEYNVNSNQNENFESENENQINSNSNLLQNRNISSSLEIILSPIIQSSRRAQ